MPQTIELKAAGLFTSPNPLRLPPGALRAARNVVISSEGITSRRRGFTRSATLTQPASVLSEYLGSLLALDGTTLKYLTTTGLGTTFWTSFPGSHTPPAGTRMNFLEASANLYFTTNIGVFMADTLSATPRLSGIPQGLDAQLSKVGTGGGWFVPNSVVGYVHTWKRTDANNNVKQGAPSFQERIANAAPTAVTWIRVTTTATITHATHGFTTGDQIEITGSSDTAAVPNGLYTITVTDPSTYTITVPDAGGANGTANVGKYYNISITVTIPDDILAGDVLEIWRTDMTATDDDAPGDDHRLILTHVVTAGDITAGTITKTDDQVVGFLSDFLYTNQTQETRAQANDRPPRCRFLAHFKGHTFYFDPSVPHFAEIQLLTVTGITDDADTITLNDGTAFTFTFSTAEDQGARKFKRFTTGLSVVNIEQTAKSLQKIINRDATAPFYAHYISGEDDAPGKLLLVRRDLADTPFTVASTEPTVFRPDLTSPITSSDDNKGHAAARSKFEQPEAVPALNENVFGVRNAAILGVLATREALFVFKEDGLFALTGETDGRGGFRFVTTTLDPSVRLIAPNTLRLFAGEAVGFVEDGIITVGLNEPALFSRPQIEDTLFELAQFSNFNLAHAAAYESDHKYLLALPSSPLDTTATQIFVFDKGSTPAWTVWDKPTSAMHVLSTDDKLYLAHAADSFVLIERKDFSANGSDFQDETIPVNVTAFDNSGAASVVTATYTYTTPLERGFMFRQGTSSSQIESAVELSPGSWQFTLRALLPNLALGGATITLAIPTEVEWLVTAGNPASLKRFSFIQLYFETLNGLHTIGFRADHQQAFDEITEQLFFPFTNGWGLDPFGEFPWGNPDEGVNRPLRSLVHRNHQLCRFLHVRLTSRECSDPMNILCLSCTVDPISLQTERQP